MKFKEYVKKLEVNGITVPVAITVEVHDGDVNDLLDQDFDSDGRRAEYVTKLENGDVFAGTITVTVAGAGVEAFDSLSACELRPNNMFNSKPFEDSVNYYVNEQGMEAEAIAQFVKTLGSEFDRLIAESAEAFNKAQEYAQFRTEEK